MNKETKEKLIAFACVATVIILHILGLTGNL